MSVLDLKWEDAPSSTIVNPLEVASSNVNVKVTNLGAEDLTNLKLFVVPSTSLGDVDHPSDNPAETDYQDLLEWGSATDAGITGVGGLFVDCEQNGGVTFTGYITRTQGATKATGIDVKDLGAGLSTTITLRMETPPAVSARRFYINVALEN